MIEVYSIIALFLMDAPRRSISYVLRADYLQVSVHARVYYGVVTLVLNFFVQGRVKGQTGHRPGSNVPIETSARAFFHGGAGRAEPLQVTIEATSAGYGVSQHSVCISY